MRESHSAELFLRVFIIKVRVNGPVPLTFTNDHFDVSGRINPSEEEIRRKILRCTEGSEPHEIAAWSKAERDTLLRQLKEKEGLSIRQIERATGISRGVIARS